MKWSSRIGRRLARAEQSTRVRIARDELRRLRELTQTIQSLEAEIADLVASIAPQLLSEPGFGPLTAAKLVGEVAGASRFSSDAKLARSAGLAPIPVSSGKPTATASIAVVTARSTRPSVASPLPALVCHPETQTYITRNTAKAKPTAKRSAASNATSHAATGTSSSRPPRPANGFPLHQLLDIGAAEAAALCIDADGGRCAPQTHGGGATTVMSCLSASRPRKAAASSSEVARSSPSASSRRYSSKPAGASGVR
jgi:hypothetical protein